MALKDIAYKQKNIAYYKDGTRKLKSLLAGDYGC